MQKVNTIQKRIICVVLTLVMVLALAPMLETTAQAATPLDLSNPPTANVTNQWSILRDTTTNAIVQVTYLGAGPLAISGSNAAAPFGVRAQNATAITIANNTNFVTTQDNRVALTVPTNAIITGDGSGITFNVSGTGGIAIDGFGGTAGADGVLILRGALGNINSIRNGITTSGSLRIEGNIGNIQGPALEVAGGAAIRAARTVEFAAGSSVGNLAGFWDGIVGNNIGISGTVGNIAGNLSPSSAGFWLIGAADGNLYLRADGIIGNISNVGHGVLGGANDTVVLAGQMGSISSSGTVFNAGNVTIRTPLTIEGRHGMFASQPTIEIPGGFTAIWRTYRLDGSVDPARSGRADNDYPFNAAHQFVAIFRIGEAPIEVAPDFTGWVDNNGEWSFYYDGLRMTGWQFIGGYWYFFNTAGVMQANQYIDGYFLGPDGRLGGDDAPPPPPPPGNGYEPPIVGPGFYGWYFSGGNWYHYVSSVRSTGWVFDGGWYFMDANGVMQTGWIFCTTYNGWYFLNSSGLMQTGWLPTGGGGYHFLKDCGAMAQDEWIYIGEEWYFFDAYGVMVTGWVEQDGIYYYLTYPDGHMARGYVYVAGVLYAFLGSGESLGPVEPEGEG